MVVLVQPFTAPQSTRYDDKSCQKGGSVLKAMPAIPSPAFRGLSSESVLPVCIHASTNKRFVLRYRYILPS